MEALTRNLITAPAPNVHLTTHLNKAYIFYDINEHCNAYGIPYLLDVKIYQYKEGTTELIDDNIEDSVFFNYSPQRFAKLIQDESLPKHQVFYPIENRLYKFIFQAGYFYNATEGSNIDLSFPREIIVDNTTPTVAKEKMQMFYQGELRDFLQKNKKMNVYFDYELLDLDQGDIVNIPTTHFLKRIAEVRDQNTGVPEYRFLPLDKYTARFLASLFSDPQFESTVLTYFNNEIPEDGLMPLLIDTPEKYRFPLLIQGNINHLLQIY